MIQVEIELSPPRATLAAWLVTSAGKHRLLNKGEPECDDIKGYVAYWQKQAQELRIPFEMGRLLPELLEDVNAGDTKYTKFMRNWTKDW